MILHEHSQQQKLLQLEIALLKSKSLLDLQIKQTQQVEKEQQAQQKQRRVEEIQESREAARARRAEEDRLNAAKQEPANKPKSVVQEKKPETKLIPMTLEGCVVRMADTVSYIGRDIEDAIRLNMIKRSDLPKESTRYLGETNGTIVFNLVSDIIKNSVKSSYIAFSPEVSEALKQLKDFNLEHIYLNPAIKKHLSTIKSLFEMLFERYLEDIERKNHSSVIFSGFLKDISPDYIEKHCNEEIVRDFIAGMTDQYFLRQCPEKIRPTPLIY